MKPEKWRSNNWINKYADARDKEIKNDKHIAFEMGASTMLAARDKWRVEQIEGIGNDCEILACANECLNIKTCKQWQSLKQSILNAGKN